MSATLKKLIGDAGAGMDKSHGTDGVYEVLVALATQVAALTASLNQLITDYDAETNASHTATSAAAVTDLITIE